MTSIELYYANWCPHCHNFMPAWEGIKKWCDEHGVEHQEYEDSKDRKIMEERGIQGFPTVLITRDGKSVEVQKRDKTAIIAQLAEGVQSGGMRLPNDKISNVASTRYMFMPYIEGKDYYMKYLKYKRKYLKLKAVCKGKIPSIDL